MTPEEKKPIAEAGQEDAYDASHIRVLE